MLSRDTMAQEHCLGTVRCTFADPESEQEICPTHQRRGRLHGNGLMLPRHRLEQVITVDVTA